MLGFGLKLLGKFKGDEAALKVFNKFVIKILAEDVGIEVGNRVILFRVFNIFETLLEDAVIWTVKFNKLIILGAVVVNKVVNGMIELRVIKTFATLEGVVVVGIMNAFVMTEVVVGNTEAD